MGECINLRRGGEKKKLPVLNPNYPADCSGMRSNGYFDCVVNIAEHGYPAEYTYQWFINGTPYSGATHWSFSYGRMNAVGTYSIYCEVTNKAGTVRSRTATITLTDTYLYNFGYDNTSVTGGWHLTRSLGSNQPHDLGTLSYPGGNQIQMNLAWSQCGFLSTRNKVDLTHYSTIKFYVYLFTHDADYPFYCCAASNNYGALDYMSAATQAPYAGNWEGWYSIDVDVRGLSGSYYIGVLAWAYQHTSYATFGAVRLIP